MSKKKNTTTVAVKEVNPLKKYYYLFGLLAFFLFANSLGNGYNMDDSMVTMNHKLTSKGLSAIGEIFTSPYYSDDAGYAYGYRPIVHLSFALEHDLFGEKPGVGHFINVLLYALSVVLFFKLLIKFVGEKNSLFAAIATLLFTIHPIHTEVVNSLKNRDEIFAFLFVVWAALCAFKHLDKEKISSVITTFTLFSIAMLSKKSVYPMATVIPIALILLTTIDVKKLIVISLAMILPAAVIGSDLMILRMFLMIALPVFVIFITYLIKQNYLQSEETDTSINKFKWAIPLLMLCGVLAASYYLSSIYVNLFAIPLLFWMLSTHFNIGIITITAYAIGLYFIFNRQDFLTISLIILIGNTVYLWKQKKNYLYWLIACLVLMTIIFLIDFNLIALIGIGFITVFFFLIYTKTWLALIPIGIYAVVATIQGSIANPHFIAILLFTICWFIFQKTTNKKWVIFTPALALSIVFASNTYRMYQDSKVYQQNQETVAIKKDNLPTTGEKTIKEGRDLLYVENTLIAPHSKEETLATGLAVLGEYARLHLFPAELSFYYGFAKVKTENFGSLIVWFSILFHLLLIVLAIWQIKRRPLIAIGVLWYFLSILLFSNWVELVAGMVGERLAFTASAGFCIFITSIIFWISPQFSLKKPGVIGGIIGLSCLLLAGRSFVRNTNWKDEITLMNHDIQHLGEAAQVNNLYAMTLMRTSIQNTSLTPAQKLEQQKEAISYFDKATTIWPDFYNVYIDKARATMLTGDFDKGIESLNKAIEIQPTNTLSYYLMLDITEKKGDFQAYLDCAIQFTKLIDDENAYGYVARGYFMLKDYTKSREILLKGLEKYPTSEVLNGNLTILNQKNP
ncbi:MAG: glycosyltransferase family 39 protein [Crocinitomicaceae bacterium]|nr:glycosyltransferase family 39 protein [Crocinitomicaceae bacterium]